MDFITGNQQFLLGLVSTLIVWVIAKITGKTLDRTKLSAALATILDIIQDIKTNPNTKNLEDAAKKQLAVERVAKALPEKHTNIILKAFGTIGGAIEYVFHNKKWLFSAGTVVKG